MTSRRLLLPRWARVLLFVVLPLLEVFVFVQVVRAVGLGWTVVLLFATGVLGAWLVRRAGIRAWRALGDALSDGRVPTRELTDGALAMAGGFLLVLPGFVSDVLGLLLVLPGTRAVARVALLGLAGRHVLVTPGHASRPGHGTEGPVVRGEVVDP